MKKRLAAVIALLAVAAIAITLALILLRDDKHDPEAEDIRVGVAIYMESDTFLSQMMAEFTRIAQQFQQDTGRRVYMNVADAALSQSTQNGQIEHFISLDYDVLCVNLVDRTEASQIIDMATSADIPIVFFNREPVTEDIFKWDKVYYVGSDARESAIAEAQLVIDYYSLHPDLLDKNGDGVIQYIMLEGESGHQDATIRTEYSVSAIRAAGIDLERLDGGIANWNRSQAAAMAEQYFLKYGDAIELIICNNDDMALGAADAVAKLELDFSYIVGIDGTDSGYEAVIGGRMLGTVDMVPAEHARAMFDIAVALADGKDPEAVADIGDDRSVRVPMALVKNEELYAAG